MAFITRSYFYRYYQNYKTNSIFCYFLLLYGFVIVFPFFFAYQTQGFWPLSSEYSEQAQFSYSGQYAIECQNLQNQYFFTNIKFLENLNQYSLEPNLFYSKQDKNMDNKPESTKIHINIPFISFNPNQCTVLLVYNFGLRRSVKLQMQAPVLIQTESQFDTYKIFIDGSLQFKQNNPLLTSMFIRNIYNNTDFQEVYHLSQLGDQLLKRNETLTTTYKSYNLGKQSLDNQVDIQINFQFPILTKVYYIPTIFENLKSIWIQYIYLLIPTAFIVQILILFSVRRQIFFSHISVNLPSQYLSNKVR